MRRWLLLTCLFFAAPVWPAPSQRAFVVLHSQHAGLPMADGIANSILASDRAAGYDSTEIAMEYLDLVRNPDPEYRRMVAELIRHKLAGLKVEVVFAEGMPALDFFLLSVYGADNKKNDDLDLSFFLNNLDGTLSQQDMAYVMTTNHLEKLDPALYRKGRMHAMIHLKKCDRFQISCIFAKIFKKSIDEDVLEKIPENIYTPAEVIQHFLENIHNIDMTDQQIVNGLDETKNEFAEKMLC